MAAEHLEQLLFVRIAIHYVENCTLICMEVFVKDDALYMGYSRSLYDNISGRYVRTVHHELHI